MHQHARIADAIPCVRFWTSIGTLLSFAIDWTHPTYNWHYMIQSEGKQLGTWGIVAGAEPLPSCSVLSKSSNPFAGKSFAAQVSHTSFALQVNVFWELLCQVWVFSSVGTALNIFPTGEWLCFSNHASDRIDSYELDIYIIKVSFCFRRIRVPR